MNRRPIRQSWGWRWPPWQLWITLDWLCWNAGVVIDLRIVYVALGVGPLVVRLERDRRPL